jgi:glucokinase
MAVIAVDLGGTRIKFGVVEEGKLLATAKLKAQPNRSTRDNLDEINHAVKLMMKENRIDEDTLTGIGLSLPSIVNSDTNKVISRYVKYNDAHDFDFNKWAHEEWNLPVVVENDARCALIGEWQYGAGKGYSNIGFMILGTGIGTAVLYDEKLIKGKHFLAGNLGGHTSINVNAGPCNCGFFGCLEAEASTWALSKNASANPLYNTSSLAKLEAIEFAQVFEEAAANDPLALILLEQSLKAWGVSAVNMIHSFDPEVIVIGGGIMKRKSQILPYLQQMIDKYAWIPAGSTKVVAAEQVEYAGLLGVGYLVNMKNKEGKSYPISAQ